tara:strand:+ start:640 stop:1497 length:858 start_codon:yes stop_codon:yes gene_type:complete
MFLLKKFKLIIKFLVIVSTYPFTFLYIYIFSKEKIYEKIFRLYFSTNSKKKSGIHFILRFAFDSNYYYYPRFLQQKYIAGSMGNPEEGIITANYYRSKGFPDETYESNIAYKYLTNYIKANKYNNLHIHQVGASSGREINYFSKLSNSIIFEASDLTKDIADNIKYNYPSLHCSVVDLSQSKNFIPVAKRCSLIVAFGGLQYLLPKDLERIFKICKLENCELIISQPLSYLVNPFSIKVSIPRGNLSWSHCYLHIASKYGYKFNAVSEYKSNSKAQLLCAHFFIE